MCLSAPALLSLPRGRGISFEKNRPCAPVWHNAALLLQKNRKAYGYELPLRDIPLLRLG